MKFSLQIKATLENISDLQPNGEDFRWFLKLMCVHCHEVTSNWVAACLLEKLPVKGGRSSACIVTKCKLCSHENTLDIIPESIKPYTAEDSGTFKTIVTFECRGMEPVDFEPRDGFCAVGTESGTTFGAIDLAEKDWTDYDEAAQHQVNILDLEYQLIKGQ
ncbi:hypothetical protein EMCRGX_G018873 [Ephydatia muelleri]